MNERTSESLAGLLAYWQGVGGPLATDAIAEIEAALATPVPLTDERFHEYFERLQGPEGCDFADDTWTCAGGYDKQKSTAILRSMGLTHTEIAAVHRLVDALGGHCDCEIIFNAAERILPQQVSA